MAIETKYCHVVTYVVEVIKKDVVWLDTPTPTSAEVLALLQAFGGPDIPVRVEKTEFLSEKSQHTSPEDQYIFEFPEAEEPFTSAVIKPESDDE